MFEVTGFTRPMRWTTRKMVALVLLAEALIVGVLLGYEWTTRRAVRERMTFKRSADGWWKETQAKPIVRPETVPASEAKLRPEEPVIGVVVGGKPRAYRLAAFRIEDGHLVNDMLAGVPVSVCYCNVTDCVRVYTDSASEGPLDVQVAGLLNLEMVVKVGGQFYYQKSGKPVEPDKAAETIPYRQLAAVRTTWGAWCKDHPDTDVFEGTVPVIVNRPPPR